MEPVKRLTSVLKCEKHGLHYDSAKTSGCVVCRQESGEISPPSVAAAASSGSLGAALAFTVVLLAFASIAMQLVHTQVIASLPATVNSSTKQAGNPYQKQIDGVLKEIKKGSEEPAETP